MPICVLEAPEKIKLEKSVIKREKYAGGFLSNIWREYQKNIIETLYIGGKLIKMHKISAENVREFNLEGGNSPCVLEGIGVR